MSGPRLEVADLLRDGVLAGVLEEYRRAPDDHVRHARLSELKALLVELGRPHFEAAAGDAITLVLDGPAGADRLGLCGVRALLDDAPLFTSVARALFEACGEAAEAAEVPARIRVLLGCVTFPGEVVAARGLLERSRREVEADLERELELLVGARLEALRPRIGPELGADFAEVEPVAMAASFFGLAREGTEEYRAALVEAGGLEADPFDQEDPLLSEAGELAPEGDVPATPAPPEDAAEHPLEHLRELVRSVDTRERTRAEALRQVPLELVARLSRPFLEPGGTVPMGGGRGVSPGGGAGELALSVERAGACLREGRPYVLVVREVFGDEAEAVRGAEALVTLRGGSTSHAAMVAANSGVPCVVAEAGRIDLAAARFRIGDRSVPEGEGLAVDGSLGLLYPGILPAVAGTETPEFRSVQGWADEVSRMRVLVNADTPEEAGAGLAAGAAGVGLVRSEHMFFGAERLEALRRVVLADPQELPGALSELGRLQQEDFRAWFAALGGTPVTFRLLDAPLHEFLPRDLPTPPSPSAGMMGVRAVRLSLLRPEIEAAQVRALVRSWRGAREAGQEPAPLRILVPMVCSGGEMALAAERIRAAVEREGEDVPMELGAMLELPRAALDAGAIAAHADFLAWGTNDLTQFTLGLGRDDADRILSVWKDAGVDLADPTRILDPAGPGALMRLGEQRARRARPEISSGVCGRHASDPRSILFLESLGVDYLSVPPAQVAAARLAAAQAALNPASA